MSRSFVIAVASSTQGTACMGLDRNLVPAGPSPDAGVVQGIPDVSVLIELALRQAARDGTDLEGVVVACSDTAASQEICREAGRFAVPVSTAAFAQAAMEGERLRGAAAGRASALLLDTDGLSVGLLLNGATYRGGSGTAGQVAHLGLARTGALRCTCGRTGCLSALVAAGEAAPEPPLPADSRPMPSRQLGWLAVALVALLNTANPEVLILSGALVAEPDDFEWLADMARLGCLAPTRAGLVGVARARCDRAAVGAAALAFRDQLFAFPEERIP